MLVFLHFFSFLQYLIFLFLWWMSPPPHMLLTFRLSQLILFLTKLYLTFPTSFWLCFHFSFMRKKWNMLNLQTFSYVFLSIVITKMKLPPEEVRNTKNIPVENDLSNRKFSPKQEETVWFWFGISFLTKLTLV